jgi:hypothetical protein
MSKFYPLDEAMKAQQALRGAAHMPPEQFPLEAFVGMVSDEIEQLRAQGQSDEQIATLIVNASAIDISAEEIKRYYVPPEQRQRPEH